MQKQILLSIAALALLPFIVGHLANSVVCITDTGSTILCPLSNPHTVTGYMNGAGWVVNADGSIYWDIHGNRVAA